MILSIYINSSFPSLSALKNLFLKITPSAETFSSSLLVYLFSSHPVLQDRTLSHTHTSDPALFPFHLALLKIPAHISLPIGSSLFPILSLWIIWVYSSFVGPFLYSFPPSISLLYFSSVYSFLSFKVWFYSQYSICF